VVRISALESLLLRGGNSKIACVLLLLIAESVAAQGAWTFEDRHYYDPLIAGVRAPNISALALAYAARMNFMIKKDSPRRVWDIDVGGELPIAGWEKSAVSGHVGAGTFGWGAWLVIDFHTIEDFVDESAPIVNADARNMQNFSLLKSAGRSRKPVLLKRGMSATLEELFLSAEYIMSEGNFEVMFTALAAW
jgi:DAHP synthetase I family